MEEVPHPPPVSFNMFSLPLIFCGLNIKQWGIDFLEFILVGFCELPRSVVCHGNAPFTSKLSSLSFCLLLKFPFCHSTHPAVPWFLTIPFRHFHSTFSLHFSSGSLYWHYFKLTDSFLNCVQTIGQQTKAFLLSVIVFWFLESPFGSFLLWVSISLLVLLFCFFFFFPVFHTFSFTVLAMLIICIISRSDSDVCFCLLVFF